jgi:hypothetical protein
VDKPTSCAARVRPLHDLFPGSFPVARFGAELNLKSSCRALGFKVCFDHFLQTFYLRAGNAVVDSWRVATSCRVIRCERAMQWSIRGE